MPAELRCVTDIRKDFRTQAGAHRTGICERNELPYAASERIGARVRDHTIKRAPTSTMRRHAVAHASGCESVMCELTPGTAFVVVAMRLKVMSVSWPSWRVVKSFGRGSPGA